MKIINRKENDMNEFTKRLKIAMNNKNMRAFQLCEKTGIAKSTISQYLSGASKPKNEKLKLLAEALEVTEDYFDREKEPIEEDIIFDPEKITPASAAKCLNQSAQFVSIGLQRGLLPFGVAWRNKGVGRRFTYYINPIQFKNYVGEECFNKYFHNETKNEKNEEKN